MLLYLVYGGMPTITHHIYYYYHHHHLSILFYLRYSLLIVILLFSVLHLCKGLDFPSHLFSHVFIWYLLMIYEVLRSTSLCDNLRSMRSPMIYFARWNKEGNQYLTMGLGELGLILVYSSHNSFVLGFCLEPSWRVSKLCKLKPLKLMICNIERHHPTKV
jgi:hypothetical protein